MESALLVLIVIGLIVLALRVARIAGSGAVRPADRPETRPPAPIARPVARQIPPLVRPVERCPPAAPGTPTGETLEGPARIIDGDSLVIRKTQVRLFGVDAPELTHPHGNNAKWALIHLCKGQVIRAEVTEIDDYGRTVARCYLPDGRDLSAEMVKAGFAIDWGRFSDGLYRALEVPDARKKMWLADARQKGRMDVWERFEAGRKAANRKG